MHQGGADPETGRTPSEPDTRSRLRSKPNPLEQSADQRYQRSGPTRNGGGQISEHRRTSGRLQQQTLSAAGGGSQGRDGIGPAGEDSMAVASGARLPEPEPVALQRTGGADERRAASELRGALFPPGPADHDAWRELLRTQPHLAPAIEPGFCVRVDELAVVVDEARTDQLRAGGNGVVALQGAVAFRVLAKRAGLI